LVGYCVKNSLFLAETFLKRNNRFSLSKFQNFCSKTKI
jgi:hypothetical protein